MIVTVVQYNSETPSSDLLQEDKERSEKYELGLADAILLLQRLRSSHGRISFKGESCTADFTLDRKELLELEITCDDSFWAISEVNDTEAESILGMLYRGEDFGELIPGTDREWDAWGDRN